MLPRSLLATYVIIPGDIARLAVESLVALYPFLPVLLPYQLPWPVHPTSPVDTDQTDNYSRSFTGLVISCAMLPPPGLLVFPTERNACRTPDGARAKQCQPELS
jgi:hypothetical protein